MVSKNGQPHKRVNNIQTASAGIDKDPGHHLTGPFLPQTPLGGSTPTRAGSPANPNGDRSAHPAPWWLQWAVNPYTALKVLAVPLVLYVNWEVVTPYVAPGLPNPFAPIFLLSGYIEDSKPEDPRYTKTHFDLAFLAYYIVFFSFVREFLATKVAKPIGRYFGLKKEAKLDRFAEQFYALVYFTITGIWGYCVMSQQPSYWYNTKAFWKDYPHWDLEPMLKRYYLMQFSYWCQQFIVLVLGLEKPRKDYYELVAHHFVTLWLVGWSYLLNYTIIGSAVYMSMDIPDAFLAASKLLNYIQWNTAKIYAFVTFIVVWSYFRHYLNLKILYSVWFESRAVPESSKVWDWSTGAYLPFWMPYAIWVSIAALQVLNLFWYYLMWKILLRAIVTKEADDDRSDDEDDGEDEEDEKKK
ncbi:longevity assurance proteins LAG1 LAC1 [Ephemerocybe angulata]|uniref:Longevity assurance proteins LAG1 LAC1 n=1 Tax=Ephemerocybe angulata TaxID=980116 RepID=A0A8H6IB69_9AGAR|nr:longevity assurance proteins LAG1 LAC1 [Tulosesus angulatus]